MSYRLINNGSYLEIKLAGKFDFLKIETILDAIITHKNWYPGGMLLVDETQFDASSKTFSDINHIVEFIDNRMLAFENSKIALYVSRELEYGLNRMLITLAEDVLKLNINVFRSRQEALSWLLSAIPAE